MEENQYVKLEILQNMLVAFATNGTADNEEYKGSENSVLQ
jgi:hypothetical protein